MMSARRISHAVPSWQGTGEHRDASVVGILLVSEETVLAEGLAQLLAPSFGPVDCVADGAALPEALGATPVDVVVVDFDLPQCDLRKALAALAATATRPGIVALAGDRAQRMPAGWADLCATAVTKHDSFQQLLAAIVYASSRRGDVRDLQRLRLLDDQPTLADQQGFDALTPREQEVLHLIARGYDNRQLAKDLEISPNTVRTHVQNILSKLCVRSRLEAVALVYQRGERSA